MKIDKYIPDSHLIREAAGSERIPAAQAVFKAVEIKRDELRKLIEEHPRRNGSDLTEDLYFRLGQINMASWVLSLPEESRTFIEKLPEGVAPK